MSQNRNKLLDLFIGNSANAVLHMVLDASNIDMNISKKYVEEWNASLNLARRYRAKINPVNSCLLESDVEMIKKKIVLKVRSELHLRILKGYKNLDSVVVENFVEKVLKETNVI